MIKAEDEGVGQMGNMIVSGYYDKLKTDCISKSPPSQGNQYLIQATDQMCDVQIENSVF